MDAWRIDVWYAYSMTDKIRNVLSFLRDLKNSEFWQDEFFRRFVYQAALFLFLLTAGLYFLSNASHNISERSIHYGFSFLKHETGFQIGESIIPYTNQDTYARAFLVGFLNTIRVSLLGILLATLLGGLIGFSRVSKNYLAKKLASIYIESLRNIPLLLQIFFWYTLIISFLPPISEGLKILPSTYLSKAGLVFPWVIFTPIYWYMLLAFCFGLIISYVARYFLRKNFLSFSILCVIGLPLVVWFWGGMPLDLNIPSPSRFGFDGGISVTPEFLALLISLTTYTAAFIAENVRAGLQAVPRGQMEAALALGLKRSQALRLVIFPQALRVIVPPTINQYLNLTKNSSLAVAIGYPDLVSITNTSLNQTGQAIECISIMMLIYLGISLLISWIMNYFNRRVALKGG